MTSHTETLMRTLEKELRGALTLTSDAEAKLAIAEKIGYLSPQELTELLIPVRFVNRSALEKALNAFTERLKEAGIVIVAEKKPQSNQETLPQTSITVVRAKGECAPKENAGHADPLDKLVVYIAEIYRITKDDLLKKSRVPRVAFPRQIAMYLLREDFNISFPQIAEILHRDDHTTVIHGCLHIAGLYENNAEVRADIEKIRAWYRGEPAPVGPTTQPTDASPASIILDPVLKVIAESFGLAKNELIVHATRPNELERKRMKARNVAAYLLAQDFNQLTQEIAKCLGIKERSTISRLACEADRSIKRDSVLQEIVARIRAAYTLAWYGGSLSEVLKRQRVLFPKQIEEAKEICAELKKKLERMVMFLTTTELPERSQEIFLLRYGLADNSYHMMTLEEVGWCYGELTKERIRQIVSYVWKKLKASTELPFGNTQALEKAVEECASWQELIEKSG